MKLLVEFSHPAQVHKFKNVFTELRRSGVEILILSRDKDVMLELLDGLNLPHICISRARPGIIGAFLELLIRELRTLLCALKFRPDIVLSAHSVAITHVGWLLGIPRLVHEDTEFGSLQQKLYIPFASKILTSSAYYLDWGARQVRIPSLEPLAYLHPKYFTPDVTQLIPYGLSGNRRFAVIRVIAWQAMHDQGHAGMTKTELRNITRKLRAMGYDKVILSSESPFGTQFDEWVLQPRAEDLHHLLAFAGLCISESITVAGEAAVLGTPTILTNPLKAGHTLELQKHGLIERVASLDDAILAASKISADKLAKQKWITSKNNFLSSKADMAKCLTDIILRELRDIEEAD